MYSFLIRIIFKLRYLTNTSDPNFQYHSEPTINGNERAFCTPP